MGIVRGQATKVLGLSTGWLIGYVIGAAVVLIVVVLLAVLIVSARTIGNQAEEIQAALESARRRTMALWEVHEINARVGSITHRLAAARKVLGGRDE